MEYKSPVYQVIPVPIEKIQPNTYNPNTVAPPEMKLLYESIKIDGYTMPIVCYYSKESDTYIIVDGFHRCEALKQAGMLEVRADVYEMPLPEASRYRKEHRDKPDIPIPGKLIPPHSAEPEKPASKPDDTNGGTTISF